MKNIHLLPTDKPSRLIIYSTLLNEFRLLDEPIEDWKHKRNIYITNDGEIKDGEYGICLNLVREGFKSHQAVFKMDAEQRQAMNELGGQKKAEVLKVILTTDPDLIKDGVQAIDDEFLEWFVKNPSCEEVDVVSIPRCCGRCNGVDDLCFVDRCCDDHHEYGCEICYGKKIEYKIIIPKEEPKQRLEKYSERFNNKENELVQGIFNPENWGNRLVSEEPKKETPEQHLELINNNIEEFDKAIELFRQRKSKQETLEEVAVNRANKYSGFFEKKLNPNDVKGNAYFNGFIECVKWQQQQNKNLYSEQTVTEYAYYFESCYAKRPMQTPLTPSKWFEQFKKK